MIPALLASLLFQPDPDMLRRLYEEALVRRQQEYGVSDPRTAQAARDLGLFLQRAGDKAAARKALGEALRIDEIILGATAVQTLEDADTLASVSPPADAERLLRRAAESPDALVAGPALTTLADLRKAVGDRSGAALFLRRALAKAEAVDAGDGPTVAHVLNSLALLVEPKEGVVLLNRALGIDRRNLGEHHLETATTEISLSRLLLSIGRTADAVQISLDALTTVETGLGSDHPLTATAASGLAHALQVYGDRAGAERLYRRALAIDQQSLGSRHAQTLKDVRDLAALLRQSGRLAEATALERRFKAGASEH